MRQLIAIVACVCSACSDPTGVCQGPPSIIIEASPHFLFHDDGFTVTIAGLSVGCDDAAITSVQMSVVAVEQSGLRRVPACSVLDCDTSLSLTFGDAPVSLAVANSSVGVGAPEHLLHVTEAVAIPRRDHPYPIDFRARIPPNVPGGLYAFVLDYLWMTDTSETATQFSYVVSPQFGIEE